MKSLLKVAVFTILPGLSYPACLIDRLVVLLDTTPVTFLSKSMCCLNTIPRSLAKGTGGIVFSKLDGIISHFLSHLKCLNVFQAGGVSLIGIQRHCLHRVKIFGKSVVRWAVASFACFNWTEEIKSAIINV